MDPKERALLKKTHELAEKNYKLLKKLHKSMVLGRVWRTFYWILIIGLGIGAFVFLQPFVDKVLETYETLFEASQAASNGNSAESQLELQELLQQFQQ